MVTSISYAQGLEFLPKPGAGSEMGTQESETKRLGRDARMTEQESSGKSSQFPAWALVSEAAEEIKTELDEAINYMGYVKLYQEMLLPISDATLISEIEAMKHDLNDSIEDKVSWTGFLAEESMILFNLTSFGALTIGFDCPARTTQHHLIALADKHPRMRSDFNAPTTQKLY